MSALHEHGGPTCRELFARLSEYLDGEIDAEACAHVEGHLHDCPPCQAFLESLPCFVHDNLKRVLRRRSISSFTARPNLIGKQSSKKKGKGKAAKAASRRGRKLLVYKTLADAKTAAGKSDLTYPKVATKDGKLFVVCCKLTARRQKMRIVARKIDGKMVTVQ